MFRQRHLVKYYLHPALFEGYTASTVLPRSLFLSALFMPFFILYILTHLTRFFQFRYLLHISLYYLYAPLPMVVPEVKAGFSHCIYHL